MRQRREMDRIFVRQLFGSQTDFFEGANPYILNLFVQEGLSNFDRNSLNKYGQEFLDTQ